MMTAAGSQRLDAVRIRVTVAGSDVEAAARSYDLHARPSQQHELHLCERPPEHPGMLLADAGITAEVRLHPRSAISTVTLRPRRAGQLGDSWSRFHRDTHHELRVEGDWVADRRTVAASLSYGPIPQGAQPNSPTGKHRQRLAPDSTAKLFSDRQRQFVRECGRGGPDSFQHVRLYGPIQVRRWLVKDQWFDVRLERWSLDAAPAALEFMDLSVLVTPEDAALVQPAFLASTRRRGIDPDAYSGSRTHRLIDLFLLS